MTVERTAGMWDESVFEGAIKDFISDRNVHTGATRETALKAAVDRIVELVGVDNFYVGDQALESTVLDRLDTTQKTLVDITCFDVAKDPLTGASLHKQVRTNFWVQLDICTKSRYQATAVKREIESILMLGVSLTYENETVTLDKPTSKMKSTPAKYQDAGYWWAIIKLPLFCDITGAV